MNSVDVVVVGAGIAGLAATYELQRRGVSVRLLEASDRLGGVIRTDRFDGWVIDGGPDSMLVQKPAAVGLCRELGLGDRLVSTLTPRTAYVLRNGHLHPIPEGSFLGFPVRASALANSSLFSIGGKLRMACEAVLPRSEDDEDESIAAFVRRRFGEEAVDYLAEPLLAGIHAGDVERLSIRALFPRLVDAERQSGSVIRAFRALRMKPSPQGAFVSLPGGVGELVDAVAAAITGGTVTMSARVTDVRHAGAFTLDTTGGAMHAKERMGGLLRYCTPGWRHFVRRSRTPQPRRWRLDTGVIRSITRCAEPALSCRGSSATRCWPRHGSPRSGRIARPRVMCCCAASSAVAATRIASINRIRS